MAVVIETTIGDFTVDLFVDSRPQACKNFLKLCKMKYYNFCLFHSIQPNFLAQTGDPTGTGSGGESIYGLLYGENARYFEAEVMPKLKHQKPALLSMVNCGNNMLGSQFFLTLGEELVSLDGEHCVFGEITEGAEIVLRLNEAICDTQHRPYKDIRITHTVILEDPFEDPSGMIVPDMSPEATQERLANGRIGADEEIDETAGMTAAQVEELKQEREARARATILEIVGDLPDAEMAPPENVLFVCKLNPVTSDDDLEIIFSRFGKVKSCEVIRDKNTGDSLQYAFVEFEDRKSCEEAYFKMDNVLIDDRRIHVDFSQSVAKMRWKGKGRGVEYFDNKDQNKDSKSTTHKSKEKDDSKYQNRRDRSYEDTNRRRDRGREREDDRGSGRDRGRDRESDDRHRRREDRDRSRSDRRKRDEKHRREDYRDEDKRHDSKRRERETSRRRERDEESKRERASMSSTSSRRVADRKHDSESKELNGRSSSLHERMSKRVSAERDVKRVVNKPDDKKDKGQEIIHVPISPAANDCKEDNLSDSFNDSRDIQSGVDDTEKSPFNSVPNDGSKSDVKINHISSRLSKDLNIKVKEGDEVKIEFEDDKASDGKLSYKSDKKFDESRKLENVKKSSKRKRRVSESRSKKKRRYSSSSDSSSESSDSSDSSSSSDSSDYRHKKKKKLIIAKKYYRGGKLVKEVKKKKRSKDTSESDSVSEESSESDSKRKRRNKKHKKVTNIYKPSKRKSNNTSDESQTESSSSDDSDVKSKKKKSKVINKVTKKKSKDKSSKKKRNKKDESSSSSDSGESDENKSHSKKHKNSHKGVRQHLNQSISNTTN